MNSYGEIKIPAGDSALFSFEISGDGIELEAGDSLLFIVFDRYASAVIFQKEVVIVDGEVTIELTAVETSAIDPGDYVWNARIKNGDNVISLFVDSPRFSITEVS